MVQYHFIHVMTAELSWYLQITHKSCGTHFMICGLWAHNLSNGPLDAWGYCRIFVSYMYLGPWKWCIHLAIHMYISARRNHTLQLCVSYNTNLMIIPPPQRSWKGVILVSPCPSVRLWTESCPPCIFNNTHRIHFIFAHLIKQLHKVCHV